MEGLCYKFDGPHSSLGLKRLKPRALGSVQDDGLNMNNISSSKSCGDE